MIAIKVECMKHMPSDCDFCYWFGTRPHPYKGWTDICELTGHCMDDDQPEEWIYSGDGRPKACPLIEIAEQTEPQLTEKCPFDDSLPCEWVCTEFGKCKYKPKTEPIPHDDYIESGNDHLEARCLNCHNAKDCKENHWEVCKFEPWKLTAVDDEPQTERESD